MVTYGKKKCNEYLSQPKSLCSVFYIFLLSPSPQILEWLAVLVLVPLPDGILSITSNARKIETISLCFQCDENWCRTNENEKLIYFCFCLLFEVMRYLAKWLLESFTHSTNILGNDSAQGAVHSHKLPQDWNVGFLKMKSLEMSYVSILVFIKMWILVSSIYSLEMKFLSLSSQLRTNNAGREQRDGNISPLWTDWQQGTCVWSLQIAKSPSL